MNTPASFQVLGICGSLRQKSYNMMALKTAGELMPPGLKLRITSIAELPIYNFDVQEKGFPAPVTRLRDEILAADALFFASPEYNWTIGAPLKNAIDWMSRFQPVPFLNKPAAVLSASGGPLGGSRGQYDLRRSLAGLGVQWLAKPEIFIGMAHSKFGTDGKLNDEPTRKIMTDQVVAFEDWIKRMKRAFT
ncbi:MAG TPA: NADPH-dependent FMN reductase [Burkholderiales bacterium]|nr:NADPH-dependent FMN reductase [Burkholderiales bacterium]